MSSQKPHIELAAVDLNGGWEQRDLPPGMKMKMLADNFDEVNKMGARTRLVRLDPGVMASGTIIHDFWEESYLLSGDMINGKSESKSPVLAPVYSCRPPGTPHGPFGSRDGCVVLEIQYYLK